MSAMVGMTTEVSTALSKKMRATFNSKVPGLRGLEVERVMASSPIYGTPWQRSFRGYRNAWRRTLSLGKRLGGVPPGELVDEQRPRAEHPLAECGRAIDATW